MMTTILTVLALEALALIGAYFALKNDRVQSMVRFHINNYLGNYQLMQKAETVMADIRLLKAGHNQLSENLQGMAQNDSELADRVENLSHSIGEVDAYINKLESELDGKVNHIVYLRERRKADHKKSDEKKAKKNGTKSRSKR